MVRLSLCCDTTQGCCSTFCREEVWQRREGLLLSLFFSGDCPGLWLCPALAVPL